MLKKTVTYEDYNGVERTEDFYFNLNESELMEMELSKNGGLQKTIEKIVAAKEMPAIINIFKDLVLRAYGIKSDDGKRMEKSEEISKAFSQTEAYNKIFMELAQDSTAASVFVNGIMPKNLTALAEKESAKIVPMA